MTEKPLILRQQAEKETNLEMLKNHLQCSIKVCQVLIIFNLNREYSEILIQGNIVAHIGLGRTRANFVCLKYFQFLARKKIGKNFASSKFWQ